MANKLKAILLSMVMLLSLCAPFSVVSAEETIPAGLDKLLVIYNMNHKTNGDSTYYPIHIYAGIDTLYYREVGFDLSVENSSTQRTMSKATTVVYTAMNVMDSSGNVTRYTADQLGGNFMFGQELLFAAGKWFNADTVIRVTPYALKADGSKISGKTIIVSDEAVKASNPGSALFREIKQDDGTEDDNVLASGKTDVAPTEDGKVSGDGITITADTISAQLPGGVALQDGATELTLSLTALDSSESGVETGDTEVLSAYDVNIDGVSKENDVPIIVTINDVVQNGLNNGNISVYHVEGDGTKEMERVSSVDELTGHNQFAYDPADGTLTLSLASFSEVAVVADTENAWNGTVAKAFSGGTGTETDPYIIANADQLAYLGELVSDETYETENKYYKLIADVNFGGEDNWNTNGNVFYPIGYHKKGEGTNSAGEKTWYTYGGAFEGVFDGNGHKVSNIYQNTWIMDGDYDNGYWNDAMGLFGYVYNGTVKNLTIDNFYSEGEFAPTGCVAAYAAGKATFENIAITNSHPQTYNTGVAGIVGWDDGTASNFTFKNITVDDTNTISALWGSWDVAAAGLLGYLGGNSKANLENCNVAATIDVYNDVCGNYQYYWYRYCGMMIGTVDKRLDNGKGALDLSNITATNCTATFGDRHEYYYCEFEKNTQASYTEDYQFSRVDHSELNMDANPVTCKHTHTANEDKQAVYIPFRQLFGGYGWGVDGVDLGEYNNIEISSITKSVEKFESKFTGDFLYRVGNQNEVSLSSLFTAKTGAKINNSGVYVTIDKVDENSNVSGTFNANQTDWTKGTIQFSGTGPVKVTIQDYNYCTPTVLYLEVVDATNLTSATGTTSGGNFVLLCDVNASNYVYYWNANLYGNGFKYSLNGAPTNYSSSHGHGVLMTKNATLDNLVIVGDVYDEYGAYTSNNDYNAAIDVLGETVIRNSYISGCSAPISTRANATIKNTTLYGGAVGNLIIKGGTITLEDVTTANYNDNRNAPIGMGIVIHSDASEESKLVLNGTLTQYNFLKEEDKPTDTYAKNLHSTMFGDSLSQYHFGTSPNRRVNSGIVSLTDTFNGDDITDNANTGYRGSKVTLSGVNGYVYTQLNTSGSVNNEYVMEEDTHVATMQGAVPPGYSFDYTTKNYVAKTEGSNDYCYEENGTVNISMDEGDTFNWDTSILNVTKGNTSLDYTVSMNGTDYTGKSITFDTAGDYEVTYTYTDPYNYKLNENGNIVSYEKEYTKTVNITVAVIKATTKHAEFTFGSSNTASTTVTSGNNTYVMPNVSATSSTIGSTTVDGKTIYYPIVEIVMSDGKTSHTSGWYAYFPVFSGAVTITDYKANGTGAAETFGSSTTTMPSGLSIVGDPTQLFKYQSSSTAGTSPVVKNNILVYSSPSISANRSEYNTVIPYSYQDNAGTTYYYYIGYHAPAQSYSSICVTGDTLVTMGDGSKKAIKDVSVGEEILSWNFYTGEYEVVPAALSQVDGSGETNVLHLYFEDGTELKVLGEHGIFDADLNTFIFIDENDVEEYLNHSFVKQDGDSYKTVKLVDYEITTEDIAAYTILSAYNYNAVLEDMFTVTPAHVGDNFFNPFEIGEGMKYDEASVQADIEKYGLYTYEDFADYVTYEQFVALNLGHFKVSVGKGLVTYDGLIYLIENFINR